MKSFFSAIFSIIYKFLNFLNLIPAVFVLLIGVVLYFTGTLDAYPVAMLVFQIILIFTIVYAIVATVKKMLGIENKKVKKSKGMQIVSDVKGGATVTETSQEDLQSKTFSGEKPRYYKLKQNPDYVMAEYSDRYELFLITAKGLEKVRTDYKG